MENQKKRKKRAKKVDATAYDNYVANVSNGLNPPSGEKRRKKKADMDAYDRFLQESEQQPAGEKKAEAQPEQLKMDLEAPKKRRRREKEQAHPDAVREAKKTQAEDYDAYLLEEDSEPKKKRAPAPARKKRRRKRTSAKRRRQRRRKIFNIVYIAAMLLILVGFGAVAVQRYQAYEQYRMMRQVVEDQRFYEGTTVDGYDLSGMTLQEAETFFAGSVEPQYYNRSVNLTTGEMITAEQLGYTSNYYSVLRSAWSAGRNGTLQERYDAIVSGEHAAASHTVTRTFSNAAAVKNVVDTIAGYTDQPFSEPQINGFDVENLTFTLDDGQPGYELNREKLAADIVSVMNSGGGRVETIINAIPVEVDADELREGYGRISFISTDASTSSKNRLTNLDLSCKAINGYRLEPGQEFSFNGVVGKRTAEKGYKEAGVYNGGADGMDIGGGICQVGSTLFNAAVMADMEITDREPHSKPVSYLPRGRDAAINWPNQDLKFVNVTDSPVYIVTRLTKDKQVECAVYGKLPEDGHTVVVKSSTYETIDFDTIMEIDPSMPSGAHEVVKKGRKGYKAQAWKITLDKDGNEIAKEHLCYSKYNKQDEIIRYNP